ncbi:MAG: NUDIX domain-containing protein [Planctomycetota bacterium]
MTAVRRIGIAVVRHGDLFLVGTRPHHVPLPGYSEFPGGKCEIDELPIACAVRECLEETGIAVEPVSHLATLPWSYPHGDVELHFWLCHCLEVAHDATPPTPAQPFRWLSATDLKVECFPPANATVVRQLQLKPSPAEPRFNITVRFFAAAKELIGTDTWQCSVESGCRLGSVQTAVLQQHPTLQKLAPSLLWAVDHHYADSTEQLHDGAIVACFPPVSGG